MRQFFEMTTVFTDGSAEHRIITVGTLREQLNGARDSINRTSEPFTTAEAIRTIRDEQTVAITFHTFTITFQLVPHWMAVKTVQTTYGPTLKIIPDA